MIVRLFILATICLYVHAADSASNNGISCSFCKAGLTSMTSTIQSNDDLMAQLGYSISQGCDQVPNQLQRRACRMTLDDNFPLFFQKFLEQPGTSPEDFCKDMGYC